MTGPVASYVLIAGLAAYRLTRLVVADTVADLPRDTFRAWCARGGTVHAWLAELVDCGHCVGFWLSLATWATVPWLTDVTVTPAGWLLGLAATAGAQSTLWAITERQR